MRYKFHPCIRLVFSSCQPVLRVPILSVNETFTLWIGEQCLLLLYLLQLLKRSFGQMMSRHRTGLFLQEGGFQAVVGRYLEILGIHKRHTCKVAKRSRGANPLSESFRPLNQDGLFPGRLWSSANKKALETTTVGNIWGLWSDAVGSTKSLTL